MTTETTLAERLAPLYKAADDINEIDFKTAAASPEATMALVAGAATVLISIAASMIRSAHAAERQAAAMEALLEIQKKHQAEWSEKRT